ncbi:MAG: ABC transporter permease [Opitutaceae bacterium]|jgi:ABC-2 type transport system permease protein
MHPILVLLRKDFALFFRDKAAVLLTFLVPFTLIYVFGQVFGVSRKDSGPTGIPFAVVNQSADPAASLLVDALKAEKTFRVITQFVNPDQTTRPLTEADLRPLMRASKFRFALVIPPDLLASDRIGLHLKFVTNPSNDMETQIITSILQKTIFSRVPQLIGLTDLNSTNGSNGPATADTFSRLVRIDTEQVVGLDVKNQQATRIVGGWAMQFLLFAVSVSAAALFYEKEQGLFQRILSAPVSRSHILWSKFLYGVCLGLIQLVVLFFAGRVLFGIDIEHHLGPLIVVCALAAAACTSFGMLLAAVAPSAESARGLATILILLMSAIGGAWFPVSFMPEFIQHLSKFTLVYWSMEGFTQVLWAHASPGELLPTLGILAAMTAAVLAVAVWRFNKGRIFE